MAVVVPVLHQRRTVFWDAAVHELANQAGEARRHEHRLEARNALGMQLGIDEAQEVRELLHRSGDVPRTQAIREQSARVEAGGIYAATAEGLVRYGEPLPPAPRDFGQQLSGLANPSDVQLLILVITAIFAIWVLLGRFSWSARQAQEVS